MIQEPIAPFLPQHALGVDLGEGRKYIGLSAQTAIHLTGPYARTMIVPDPATAFPVAMIRAPITARIVGGHDIDGGCGKTGQVPAVLPFQDDDRVRKPRLLEQPIQTIEGEDAQPPPFGGEILLTSAGDIVPHLMVGMKFRAVVLCHIRFKRQAMHCLGLTIHSGLGVFAHR